MPAFTTEPFRLRSSVPWSIDQRTRVVLFALNLTFKPGDDLSVISADAEDGKHHVSSLAVEYLAPVPGQEWMSAIVLKLNDELDDAGDVLVRVTYRGVASNRVRIAIGHLGGGPPDDPGSGPTPVPPYVISGRVLSQGVGLGGVALSLGGVENKLTQTDSNGAYSFTVSQYGTYTIVPSARLYDFGPQTFAIAFLSGNLNNANFTATKQTFTISGRTRDLTQPISGATVTLSGGSSATTVTDANGFFSFQNLESERSYTVTPTKAFYEFSPQSQQIESLETNRTIDMVATPIYPLTGRVTDQNGAGLGEVTVTMTGPESGVMQTTHEGTYSFIVRRTGNYMLSVSMDQNFYSFSPATVNLPGVNSGRVTNFTGTLSLSTEPSYVLEFDGTPKTVDADFFWPQFEPLGHFFWEVWAVPGENAGATYMISDGYGGAHALLFGFGFYGASEASRYQLFGNVWDGSTWTFFSSNEGPAVGEWAHLAVGWDGHQIISYFNGVPVGRASFTGPRISPGPSNGAGRLLVGGSDHNNLIGRIAQVRGYEDRNPLEPSTTATFAPQAVFSRDGSYLSYFFRPSLQIADMSNYYRGLAHRSRLRGTLYPYGLLSECPNCPLPVFVVDPTAPNFLNSPVNNSAPVSSAPPTPGQAIVFDSFSRANSTYTLQNGGLASTEGGSAGQLLWQTNEIATGRKPFGILNGRAVVLANERAVAWVQAGSSSGNLNVEASRRPGSWGSGYDTGLAFRVIDARNFFFAFTTGGENDPASARKLTVGYYADGVRRDLATNISLPADWTVLGIRTNANGQINVLADGGLVYSVTNTLKSNATGAGLYNDGPGLGLLNRWDNFIVYNTP